MSTENLLVNLLHSYFYFSNWKSSGAAGKFWEKSRKFDVSPEFWLNIEEN